MTQTRPLTVRLAEYADSLQSLNTQLTGLADQIEAKHPMSPKTEPLRDGARLYGLIADDLNKILNGEELQPFAVVGDLS